jgi:O-antigen/teichoic acid export membrane protein
VSIETPTVLALPQARRSSLSADFSWTLVGNAIYAAGQFATLMTLAKLVRPELVGQYALGLAVVYPVMMFTNLQLRQVMTSGVRQDLPFGHYLSLRLQTTALALGIILAITYGIETISDVYYARLQLHDRMAEISKSLISRALLSVLGLGIATYVSRNLLWGLAGILLARTIVLFGYDISGRTQGFGGQLKWFCRSELLRPRFDLRVQGELLWLSFPLGIVVLLGCLNSSIPSFFIKQALGERDLGIFSTLGFMVSVGNMAVVSLGQSAFTRLARSYATGNLAAFGALLSKLLVFGAMIGVCGMIVSKLAGREILTGLFRPEYADRAELLPWIMAAGGVLFMAQFLGFGMTAAGLYNSQVVLNILANVSLFAASYWLIARQGLLGAIFAMLIAAIVQLGGSVMTLVIGVQKRAHLAATTVERRDLITTISVSTKRSPAFNGGN